MRCKIVDEQINTLRQWIEESRYIVFFGGAGVSTESGIPDFRSVDGLYNQQWAYPPETILSHSFFERDPEEFYRFYHAKLVVKDAKPNMAHHRLAELEREGKLKAILTQNIDGLHQAAGSQEVLELHGSTHRCYCAKCGRRYPPKTINDCQGVPRCECGGVIRPDVVLYEEPLDQDVMERSIRHIMRADMLIVGGTSLAVYPAAGLLNYYRGNRLVLVNRGVTSRDQEANLIVRGNIGQVFAQL
jgi:NAD-dependent deacetylase